MGGRARFRLKFNDRYHVDGEISSVTWSRDRQSYGAGDDVHGIEKNLGT